MNLKEIMIFHSNIKVYLFRWVKGKGGKSIKVETKGRCLKRELLGPEFHGIEFFLGEIFTLETINLISKASATRLIVTVKTDKNWQSNL